MKHNPIYVSVSERDTRSNACIHGEIVKPDPVSKIRIPIMNILIIIQSDAEYGIHLFIHTHFIKFYQQGFIHIQSCIIIKKLPIYITQNMKPNHHLLLHCNPDGTTKITCMTTPLSVH